MLLPKRAPVKPRVFTRESGAALPLEEEIRALLAAGVRGIVHLIGPAGSGKTTALEHLAAVLPPDSTVLLVDQPADIDTAPSTADRLIVRAVSAEGGRSDALSYHLVPWEDDDLIEYLLAVHHESCAGVMNRLRDTDRELLAGNPELWRISLDEMANDPSVPNARRALRHYLQVRLSDPQSLERARYSCLGALIRSGAGESVTAELFSKGDFSLEAARVLRHGQVQLLLAAERVAADLHVPARVNYLARRLPRALVQTTAVDIAHDEEALQCLRDLVAGTTWGQPMAASLLHAAGARWVPQPGQISTLAGAYLDHAAWAGVQSPKVDLRGADLNHADLSGADLNGANVSRCNLRGALLTRASLTAFKAVQADLSGANLDQISATNSEWDGANLTGASLQDAGLPQARFPGANLTATVFRRANLRAAVFASAELTDADFTGANLRRASFPSLRLRTAVFCGACFHEANLNGCDLEGMELPGADFRSADLRQALLTGANLPNADFTEACLCGTGLGDVNLERASLRNADLRGAAFHMGSSRSGLVFTPIASEGTRTGFYTDDADEQNFKAPEEIRKANLCGADLRGARIDGVDFYLVDLRGAIYDPEQERHFRRCRAILENRTGETR